MALKFKKKIILAKIETTYGTDAVPTGAANAILALNVNITPLEAVTEERELVGFGANEKIHVGATVLVEFDVELAGSGVVDTPAAYGPLIRACAMSETVNAATSVAYDQVSANEEAVTAYFHLHGQKHAILGVRGSWGIRVTSPGQAFIHFKLVGLWADPASVVDPTPDYTAFKKPVAVNNANTTFSLHGYAARLVELTLDQNNETPYRNLVGVEEIAVADRAWSGSVTIEAPALSAKNFFTTVKNDTIAALQLVHGKTAGNIIQIDAARAQLDSPQYGDADGLTTLQMGITLLPSAPFADDEIKLTTK